MAVRARTDRGGRAPFCEGRRAGASRLHDPTRHDAHARDRPDGPGVSRDARSVGQGREPLLSTVGGVTMGMLDGKTALVTGAGRGIGRGIAIALASAGAKVVVNDLGVSLSGEGKENTPAQTVVDEIVKYGGTAKANYGSVSALGAPGQPNYAAAKAGIIGLTWSTANAMAKYGVTVNAIMPSGATRMIDSTPRGRAVFEQTGKWPSEQAVGTDRDPDNVAPIVVYLSSDAAANVNGQVFHARGFGYTLLAQPHAVRHIKHVRRWDPEELTKLFPETLGSNLKQPPSIEFGQKIDERPADEWRDLGGGRRFWKSRYEEP